MKHNGICIIIIGNIGSGKSTICKRYAKEGFVILSRDALRYMIGGGTYKFDFNIEPIIVKSFQKMVKEFLKAKFPIVIDETNVSQKERVKYIKLTKKYKYMIIAHQMKRLSQRVSVNRRMKNPHDTPNKKIREEVWQKFDSQYNVPLFKEGFHQIINE